MRNKRHRKKKQRRWSEKMRNFLSGNYEPELPRYGTVKHKSNFKHMCAIIDEIYRNAVKRNWYPRVRTGGRIFRLPDESKTLSIFNFLRSEVKLPCAHYDGYRFAGNEFEYAWMIFNHKKVNITNKIKVKCYMEVKNLFRKNK